MQELAKRVHHGEIGEIILQRGYRMHGPGGYFSSLPKPAGITDLLYQVQRFHSFIWASGGCFNDFYIHLVDHSLLDEGEWPVKAQALGGRHTAPAPKESSMWIRIRHILGGIHVFRRHQVLFRRAQHPRLRTDLFQLPARHQGVGIASKHGDCGLPSSLYKGQTDTSEQIWLSQVSRRSRIPIKTNGTTWWTPFAMTSLTTR